MTDFNSDEAAPQAPGNIIAIPHFRFEKMITVAQNLAEEAQSTYAFVSHFSPADRNQEILASRMQRHAAPLAEAAKAFVKAPGAETYDNLAQKAAAAQKEFNGDDDVVIQGNVEMIAQRNRIAHALQHFTEGARLEQQEVNRGIARHAAAEATQGAAVVAA